MNLKGEIMNWNDLEGSFLLNRVFSKSVPIDYVDIHDISIKRDGRVLLINFDLVDKLPDLAPKKWGEFNKCKAGINCSGVSGLLIKEMSTEMLLSVNIEKIDNKFTLKFSGDCVTIEFECDFITFVGPSVYLDS